MPIYEYKCDACEHRYEEIECMNAPIPDTCPSCKEASCVRRLISPSSFVLKGGGWYVTDFKGQKKSPAT